MCTDLNVAAFVLYEVTLGGSRDVHNEMKCSCCVASWTGSSCGLFSGLRFVKCNKSDRESAVLCVHHLVWPLNRAFQTGR